MPSSTEIAALIYQFHLRRNIWRLHCQRWLGMVFAVAITGSYVAAQENRSREREARSGAARADEVERDLGRGKSGSGLGNYDKPPAANDIPAHEFDIILGRPTNSSMEVRVLAYTRGEGYVRYRAVGDVSWQKSDAIEVKSEHPIGIVLSGLRSNTEYQYQWIFRASADEQEKASEVYSFHTCRPKGSSFAFSVTADSHLDENSSGAVYTQTLRNALADRPDFHFELGDTFMTGKYIKPELARGQYLAQRYYLSHLCSSAPLFFVMGNHDGESAGRGSMVWATTTRKSLFPNPVPNDFYSGNVREEPDIGRPENYYAWHWGDAQFIVLDPFRYTTAKRRGASSQRSEEGPKNAASANWYWTLGEEQYQWLKSELMKPAKYRFVFIHHLVGGAIQNQRGGVEVASLWEWGGKNLEGEYEFDQYRGEWSKPIHQLLVDAGVSIVFHGHDHFFAKQELDGIVYQEVPQPSHSRAGNTRNASEYGYLMGEFQPSSGYVRVRVEPDSVRVDYVRTYVESADDRRNGEVTYSYTLASPAASDEELK